MNSVMSFRRPLDPSLLTELEIDSGQKVQLL